MRACLECTPTTLHHVYIPLCPDSALGILLILVHGNTQLSQNHRWTVNHILHCIRIPGGLSVTSLNGAQRFTFYPNPRPRQYVPTTPQIPSAIISCILNINSWVGAGLPYWGPKSCGLPRCAAGLFRIKETLGLNSHFPRLGHFFLIHYYL